MKRWTLGASVGALALALPAVAQAQTPRHSASNYAICHDGSLSDDVGQGCTNDGPYGGSPSTSRGSSSWSNYAICHDGILSDDVGQGCANDGPYGGSPIVHHHYYGATVASASVVPYHHHYRHHYYTSDETPAVTYDHHYRHRYYSDSPSSDSTSGGWSIPSRVVNCESSGQNLSPNSAGAAGYYQIIPGTWKAYGGSTSSADQASRSEQSAVAARIWAATGGSAWSQCGA